MEPNNYTKGEISKTTKGTKARTSRNRQTEKGKINLDN